MLARQYYRNLSAIGVFMCSLALIPAPAGASEAGLSCIREHSARVDGCGRGANFQPCYKASVSTFTSCVGKLKSTSKLPAPLADLAFEGAVNDSLKPELLSKYDAAILKAADINGANALIGTRSVLSSLTTVDAQKIAAVASADRLKAKSLGEIVSSASLIEQLTLQFRKEAIDGNITPQRRDFYTRWMGELYNKIDHRLHLDFGVEVYSEQFRDGSVRAKLLLAKVEAARPTQAQIKRTSKLVDLVSSSDTYFKSLRLNEVNGQTMQQWQRSSP